MPGQGGEISISPLAMKGASTERFNITSMTF